MTGFDTEMLNKRDRYALVALERLGGNGSINDVRGGPLRSRYPGDPVVTRLEKHGLVTHAGRDLYVLTESGRAVARHLIAQES